MMQRIAPLVLLALCAAGGIQLAEAQLVVQRGAFSPSPPMRLEYEMPEALPASGEMQLPLSLMTPIASGYLQFEIMSTVGLRVINGGSARFDLNGAAQPFVHPLNVQLGNEPARYAIVLLSVVSPMGEFSRSYRIDFSAASAARAGVKSTLKIMPASPAR